jgi:O-antigen ligase
MIPVLLPPPQFLKVFAYEVALIGAAALVGIAAWRQRRDATWRMHPVLPVVAALWAWAALSFFWVRDPWWWAFGVRKLGIGVLAMAFAYVLARSVKRETVLLGIAAAALGLTLATLLRAGSFAGAGTEAAARIGATDLGWGTSNFIAALLVLMLPTVLYLALHAARPGARALGWITLPLMALVMALGASRGGSLLLVLVSLWVIFRERLTPRTIALAIGFVIAVVVLVTGPLGENLLGRFVDPRELGSIVIRLFYFREAWRRLVEHFPLGIGQGQGYGFPDHLGTEDPHNYLLVVGSELGLVGLVLWIAVLVLLWRAAGRMSRRPETRDAARALRLTIVFSQLNSLFEPTFQGLQYHFLFYWICGAYLGAYDPARGARIVEASSESSRLETNPLSP